ncbi:Glycosyltransferase [Macleaya cordata]|uniref:Glycosyltransferase n=1 Tax=Macleaya cordata TaxID=56857 RepID=A0A200QMY3_MACCD|nr:Glycosyltransferase [Macleaya cordata]
MLRTLRNRRRPRYGAPVCAIMAAILLLLSVSVLHSRLGFDRRSPIEQSGLGFQNLDLSQDSDDIDAIVVNPLLEDIENDAATTTTSTTTANNGDEDRIDELDVDTDDQSRVSNEEEILRGVDFEEESESDGFDGSSSSNSRNRHSDYVWDHVVGVTRRAFDKRSVDPWQDSSPFGFSSNSDEDRSKIAFGSDDEPVDEDVRRKLDEIRVIEDALLLKSSSHGSSSPLREGWATWFEKKGDFLRRDRMFKSNLENLNPLNNPLLQDPDGVGLTTLTRGDKIMHKALLNEFRKLPFVIKQPPFFGNAKQRGVSVDEKKLERIVTVGRNNEVKGVERRTLDDNGSSRTVNNGENIVNSSGSSSTDSVKMVDDNNGNSHTDIAKEQSISPSKRIGKELSQVNDVKSTDRINADPSKHEFSVQSGKKNLGSETQTKSEFSGNIYADGRRWGYFPGLHPHLSFSDFVTEFFKQGKCSLRVFMVWNSPPWMYSVRHQRGLESLLYHHPDACVMVFSETIELDFFKDFVKDGFKVAVAMPNLDELLKSTPTHEFASVWFEWRKTNFYPVHYSELIRLAALYKYGGLYLDSDIIVLKPLSSINNFVSEEVSGAVMAFRKHSPFIMECLKEYYSTYDETRLRWNGADLLARVAKQFLLNKADISDKQLELKMQPSSMFFPIGRQNIIRYFTAPAEETERAEQDNLFRKVLNDSYTFHFWNSVTSNLVPEPESLVSRIMNLFCIRCLDVL